MKTLTFSLDVPTISIKEKMLEEINAFEEKKNLDTKEFNVMWGKLSNLAKEICAGLNTSIGDEVWLMPKHSSYSHKNSNLGKFNGKNLFTIGIFFNPISRNTTKKTYEVILGFEYKEVFKEGKNFNDYYALTNNQEVEIYFADDSKSRLYHDETVFTKITDLNKVHELAKVGYKQLFDKE